MEQLLNMGTEPKEYSVKMKVEVIQFTEKTATDIVQWAEGKVSHNIDYDGHYLQLLNITEETIQDIANIGDYVIKGHNDNIFFIKEKDFLLHYEPVSKD